MKGYVCSLLIGATMIVGKSTFFLKDHAIADVGSMKELYIQKAMIIRKMIQNQKEEEEKQEKKEEVIEEEEKEEEEKEKEEEEKA